MVGVPSKTAIYAKIKFSICSVKWEPVSSRNFLFSHVDFTSQGIHGASLHILGGLYVEVSILSYTFLSYPSKDLEWYTLFFKSILASQQPCDVAEMAVNDSHVEEWEFYTDVPGPSPIF